ncbi:MAG: TPM domain-containing protein [Rugosibacter sp.]|nr:TPM domain-containing protein [Rugosibacter sp.]
MRSFLPAVRTALACLLLSILSLGTVNAASGDPLPVPPLTGRIVDLTNTLDAQQRAALEARLAALEQAKGAQVAVLLAPTFQPESIEQFGIRLADAWKLGRKGVDDGAILLIAKDDRQLRIEVGYGLEGALNDATAKRIISEIITPHFRQGDYYAGIDAGLAAMQTVIEGEPLPPPAATRADNGARGDDASFLPLMMGGAIAARILHSLLGLTGSLLVAGVGGSLAFWLLGSWLVGQVVGVFLLMFSLSRGSGYGGLGGFGAGGGFGGGGGGFSGGGGGFGGGGAAGGW